MSSEASIGDFQINAEQMRGGFARVAVLVEFDAGHHEHLVAPPGALPFALNHGKIFADLLLPESEIGQLGQFSDQTLRVGQMVGDADAVETALAVKINDLRHGQLAVGIIGVNVKIAQQHLCMAAVGLNGRCGTHDALRRAVSKSLTGLRPGLSCRGFAENQFADAQRGIGTAQLPEVFAPFRPLRGAF